ncbi:hypothetical protein D3C80_414910 [compost metagenome]
MRNVDERTDSAKYRAQKRRTRCPEFLIFREFETIDNGKPDGFRLQDLDLAQNGGLILYDAADRRKLFDNLAIVAVDQQGRRSRIDRHGRRGKGEADCPGNRDRGKDDAPLPADYRKSGIDVDKLGRQPAFIVIGHRQGIVPLQQLSASLFSAGARPAKSRLHHRTGGSLPSREVK